MSAQEIRSKFSKEEIESLRKLVQVKENKFISMKDIASLELPFALHGTKIDQNLLENHILNLVPNSLVSFAGANLDHLSISPTQIRRYDLGISVDLPVNFSNISFQNCSLKNTKIEANFENCDFSNASFSGADISKSNFHNNNFDGTNFRASKLQFGYAQIPGNSNIETAIFDNRDLAMKAKKFVQSNFLKSVKNFVKILMSGPFGPSRYEDLYILRQEEDFVTGEIITPDFAKALNHSKRTMVEQKTTHAAKIRAEEKNSAEIGHK